jgi:hypothetical protein
VNEPIILSAQHSLTPGSYTPVVLDSGRLANTYRDPIEIRELRISTYVAHAANDVAYGAAGMIDFTLSLGRHPITNGAVPLGVVFSPFYNEPVETGGTADPAATKIASASGQRWRFDSPFILPPGASFGGALALNPVYTIIDATVSALHVTVTAVGRFVPGATWAGRPQPVPYLSAWRSGLNPGAVTSIATPQNTFSNVFARDLRVHRFTTIGYIRSGGPQIVASPQIAAMLRGPSDGGAMQDYLQGNPLELAYFFDHNCALFVGRHMLRPRQAYEWTFFNPSAAVGTTDFLALAMIGDRPEVLG